MSDRVEGLADMIEDEPIYKIEREGERKKKGENENEKRKKKKEKKTENQRERENEREKKWKKESEKKKREKERKVLLCHWRIIEFKNAAKLAHRASLIDVSRYSTKKHRSIQKICRNFLLLEFFFVRFVLTALQHDQRQTI